MLRSGDLRTFLKNRETEGVQAGNQAKETSPNQATKATEECSLHSRVLQDWGKRWPAIA